MIGALAASQKKSIKPIVLAVKPKKLKRKSRAKYLHPKPLSKSVRILDLVESKGQVGMTTTQIRKALWEMTYPDQPYEARNLRGYWSTNLTGSNVRYGLLTFFCRKVGRRWIRNVLRDHYGTPWAVMDREAGFKQRSRFSTYRGTWNTIAAYGPRVIHTPRAVITQGALP